MPATLLRACCVVVWLVAAGSRAGTVEPKVVDRLQPVRLGQSQLSGEIGRRIADLIYKNYMVLDLEHDFLDPFRQRPAIAANGVRYIGVGKVIDAGSRFATYTGDAKVGQRTAQLVAELMKTRDPDGYLGHMPAEPDGRQNYRNWILHDQEYTVLGLVDHWRYCGDERSLQYARQLADYVLASFPKNAHPENVCTAGLPEAMLALYAATGDARYRRFAAEARHGNPHGEVECSSLCDWDKTASLRDRATGHVYVNVARCYSQTLLYRWEPDEKLLRASRLILRELTRRGGCMFIIGSASDGEHFSYTQNGRGATSESCVTAYLIRWLDSLMRLDGDLRDGDLMERSIYNALFAAQDPAGRRLRYFTPFTGPRAYYGRDGFCCPGNYRRIVAELPEMVYYRTADGGVAVNLFTASKATIGLDGGRTVTLQQQTDYPSSGRVEITVTPSAAAEFPLRLRVPRWCPKARLTVAGQPPREVAPGEQCCEIRRTWKPGDKVMFDMPMPWRLVRGYEVQQGRVALMRGPVVYCIGTAANAALLKQYTEPRDLTIDPASLGQPVADPSVRLDGLKVVAKAWPPGQHGPGPATLDVVLTEFVDPSGVATYFRIPDLAKAVDDELTTAVDQPATASGDHAAAAEKTPADVPPGAAAVGYTKCVIREKPTAADVAPGRNGTYKWFSGQWYAKDRPTLDHYSTQDGVLALKLGGDLVSTPLDFSPGKLPLLPGDEGFYVEFDVRLSDNDRDHWPAVWLMPAEHDGRRDHYEGDPPHFERFMELDVDEGGFGPGLTGTVHSTAGVWPNWKHVQNPNNVVAAAIDRSQLHTFGASYDPKQQKATWWVDGKQQMSAGAPYVPEVAARQHFYLIVSAQAHKAKKPYTMFVSGVRAYVPEKSSLSRSALPMNTRRPTEAGNSSDKR